MRKIGINKIVLIISSIFFILYLIWLRIAYTDVAWMDQIQIVSGNIKHLYNKNLTIQDFYYMPPFMQTISTLEAFINCKLFGYRTWIENILSGVFLLLIINYFIRSQMNLVSNKHKILFFIIASFIAFSLHKWEMSLLGLGFGVYMVVFVIFICMNIAHKYYLNEVSSPFIRKYFVIVYIGLCILATLEATTYFLPFFASMLVMLFLNYKLFRNKIDIKKWKTVLIVNICMMVFAVGINSAAEKYSMYHPYEGYGKVNYTSAMNASLKSIVKDPLYAARFFFISNTGNLLDHDRYDRTSFFGKTVIPSLGFLAFTCYIICIYLFVKGRKVEFSYSINLIVYTIIFYILVLLGRLQMDEYYGASSRYCAATFSSVLALFTIFLSLISRKAYTTKLQKLLYCLPIGIILLCYLETDRDQLKIAPYRKASYYLMTNNLKYDENLESLAGWGQQITEEARNVMIRNQLNLFRPKTKLNNDSIHCKLDGLDFTGFNELENLATDQWRWTNGEAKILLPNFYTDKDFIRVKLYCQSPRQDTPTVILNDNFKPSSIVKFDKGFEFIIPVYGPKVLYKVSILNNNLQTHFSDSTNNDTRAQGLAFKAITFGDYNEERLQKP
jgi:hypothetical protein